MVLPIARPTADPDTEMLGRVDIRFPDTGCREGCFAPPGLTIPGPTRQRLVVLATGFRSFGTENGRFKCQHDLETRL